MKKHLIILSFIFFLSNYSLLAAAEASAGNSPQQNADASESAPETKYRFAYFNLVYQSDIPDYQFLSASLVRSMRSVLSNQGFITVDSQGRQLTDIYDRQSILTIGKELTADLVLCGKYYITGEGVNTKINLIIIIYDIKGGERVIQKLVIGGTGTAMFVMIDESADIIKDAVKAYFKRRLEILEEAKKKREEMERIAEAERKKKQEEELNRSLVKTRYNNSMYLDSHVAREKQLKVFYFLALERNDMEFNNAAQDNSVFIPSNLAVSYGLGKNLEIKLDISFLFFRSYDQSYSGVFDSRKKSSGEMYNPTLGVKWRFLQNENHGFNGSFYFGFQPGLSENAYGGSIFYFISLKSIHTIYANFTFDKTLGKFTPYLNFENQIGIRYKGIYGVSFEINDDSAVKQSIIDFGPNNKRIFFSLRIKLGTEIRFNSWFFINVGFSYGYQSGYENTYYMGVFSTNFLTATDLHSLTPSIKVIFEVKPNLALSLDFQYNFFLNKLMTRWDMGESEVNLKTSFKLIFYAAWSLDF